MLELAVLGLLAEQPLHGYELKKRLSETLGPLWGISFGSLYPALRRLERSARSRQTETHERRRARQRPHRLARRRPRRGPPAAPRPARPAHPQGLPDHRRGAGTAVRRAPHRRATDDERTFALKLSFCRYLDTDDRLAFLERRRNQLTAAAQPRRAARPSRTIDRYTRSLLEHRARSTQHDLEWIDELIAEERASQLADHTEGAASA